jgi:hypothetical protein
MDTQARIGARTDTSLYSLRRMRVCVCVCARARFCVFVCTCLNLNVQVTVNFCWNSKRVVRQRQSLKLLVRVQSSRNSAILSSIIFIVCGTLLVSMASGYSFTAV